MAIKETERLLDLAVTRPISTAWRMRVFQLAEALFLSIHMQLSVRLYRGQAEVRGANLDGIDFPLNNRHWLKERFAEIRALSQETERLANIRAVVNWTNPGPGGFYEDLSVVSQSSHVVKGPGYHEDPAFLRSAQRHFDYRKDLSPLRLSWRSFTGSLNDSPFEMHYENLDPNASYRIKLVYSNFNSHVKVRLEANDGIEIHPFISKQEPPEPVEFEVPCEVTQGGKLTLRCFREPGAGGNGRGCEIGEIWVTKVRM